jgi:DNA-binding XRE family transcriptional regulator
VAERPVRFGGLLRQLRTGAGLTQEELAEAASVSVRSVRDLERGRVASPQKGETQWSTWPGAAASVRWRTRWRC